MRAASRLVRIPSWETRLLAVVVAVLVVFGVAAVYGASSIVAVQQGEHGAAFAVRQLLGVVVGVVLLSIAARTDYRLWQRHAWAVLGVVALLLLVLLLPFASPIVIEANGARRWVGIAGVSFQPAEVAKFAVVAWTAMLATKKAEGVRDFKRGVLPFLVVIGPIMAMVLFEPALSTTVIIGLLAGTVLFAAGARVGHFLLLGLIALPILWSEIATTQYRLQRMVSFLSPGGDYAETSWQVQQSLIGMGAGGLVGVGFGEGMQKLGYLPYAYSDFIFSTIGEEWGFIGAALLVLLFAIYVGLGLRIARTAPDRFGVLLATGVTAMIGVTAVLHMAVTMGIMPATGLPLPFVSYGRSNLLVSMLATGVLINIGDQRSAVPTSLAAGGSGRTSRR